MNQCSHCKKVFKYESERKRHELSHLPRFGCEKCGKKFTYMSALKRHKKQHERTGSVKCDKCNRSFKDEVLLKRHIKYAHEGTLFCSNCDAQFSSHQALRIHTLTHKPKSERRYSCSFTDCNKKFNFSHHLKYHEMTHTKNIQYFCNVCGKGFIQLHNLKVHINTHEPHKLLPCKINDCKKKFKSEYARKRHYAQHKTIVIEGMKPQDLGTPVHRDTLLVGVPECSDGGESSILENHVDIKNKMQTNISEDISNEIIPKTHVTDLKDTSGEQEIGFDIKESDEYVSTCRSILGKCIVTGDLNGNANCLCDQMVKVNTNCNKVNEISKAASNKNKSLLNNISNDNVTKTTCGECVCSAISSDDDYNKVMMQESRRGNCGNDSTPKFEYGINGTVKIISTIDEELESIVSNSRKSMTDTKPITVQKNGNHTVPYNSCKAVLGKCIVSGNGMMSDDCLCAKMLIDDQQMTSEEIEEITPQPYDCSMYL